MPCTAVWAQQDPAAEIAQLRAEVERLKAENAALKEKVAQLEKSAGATRPVGDLPPTVFALGPTAALGNYKYEAPAGWASAASKDGKLAVIYRSPDKVAVIQVQLKPKGAAPQEMQAKYAQTAVQMLKQDFVKNKTEVVEPPAVQKDPRFYLKLHERIRAKTDKVADQTHLYLMPGKDLIEVTVITTAEATDQVAAAQKLAEDLLLSFRPEK